MGAKKDVGFQVDLASALALAKRLEDRPTAEDAQRGADCIKSMIRELAAQRSEAAQPYPEALLRLAVCVREYREARTKLGPDTLDERIRLFAALDALDASPALRSADASPYRPCALHGGYDPSDAQCPTCLADGIVVTPRRESPKTTKETDDEERRARGVRRVSGGDTVASGVGSAGGRAPAEVERAGERDDDGSGRDRTGGVTPNASLTSPADVARGCLLSAIEHLEYNSSCPFCDAGASDEFGGDTSHTEECPLVGYDLTKDVEVLRAFAKAGA
jgi:hypothetical protein